MWAKISIDGYKLKESLKIYVNNIFLIKNLCGSIVI